MAFASWDRSAPEQRDPARDRLLARWLNGEVAPFSAFWGERLAGRDVRAVSDLSGLEAVEEAVVAGAGGPGNPALLVLPSEDGFKRNASRAELFAAAREAASGGQSGRRNVLFRRYKPVHVHEAGLAVVVAVAYTRTDLDRLHLAGARLVEVLGLGADDRLVNAVPAGPSIGFWGLYHAALAARMTALHPRQPGEAAAASVARATAILPPTVLAAPVDEAEALLAELLERGIRLPDLRTVLTVGPPPSTARREAIAAAAAAAGPAGPVRVQAVWAPAASRVLWGECRPRTADPHEAAYGLHTYPDMEVVHVRDLWRRTDARPGAGGEVVLTSLGWRGTALVRFATGAWTGGLVDVPCPNCRRTVPRLAPHAVENAWQPRVTAGDGRSLRVDLRRATTVLDAATLSRLGVRDWSLRAVDGKLVLGLDVDRGRSEAVADLARAIGRAVGGLPSVRVGVGVAGLRPRLGEGGSPEEPLAP